MSLLGNLAVNFLANTRGYDRPLDRSRKKTTQFTKTVTSMGTKIAGVFAAGAIVRQASAFAQEIDEISKAARRLELSVGSMQVYRRAADLSGLSTSELTNAVERMNDTVGAALLGEQGAIKAFERLGLTVEDLQRAGDPLAMIQKQLMGIDNVSKRMALTRDIFGRTGGKVLNLFETDLRGVREEMEATGQLMSDETAQNVEKFNDSMTKLKGSFGGLGVQIANVTAGPLTKFVDKMTEGIKVAAEMIEQSKNRGFLGANEELISRIFGTQTRGQSRELRRLERQRQFLEEQTQMRLERQRAEQQAAESPKIVFNSVF